MKARIKATGEIVEIVGEGIQNSNMVMTAHGEWFTKDELDIVPLSWKPFEPTYWQKLEHQYVGMAMQGIVMNEKMQEDLYKAFGKNESMDVTISDSAIVIAHTLVQKLNEKEERK